MGESSDKTPNREVIESLWDLDIETSEKAQSMTSEIRERVSTQVEVGGLRRPAYSVVKQALRRGRKHPFDAVKDLEQLKILADWGIDKIRRDGHVGDIAEMAEQAAKQDEPAPQTDQVQDNVVALQKGIKPLEDKPAKAKKAKAEKDTVDAFREDLRSTIADGDKHIKEVAQGETPPATMPDIPEELDRRTRAEEPDKREFGRYKLTS